MKCHGMKSQAKATRVEPGTAGGVAAAVRHNNGRTELQVGAAGGAVPRHSIFDKSGAAVLPRSRAVKGPGAGYIPAPGPQFLCVFHALCTYGTLPFVTVQERNGGRVAWVRESLAAAG